MISMPSPSHHSDHTEGPRYLTNEETIQEQRPALSSRSELLSQHSSGHGRVIPMHRPKRSRRLHERHRSEQALVPSDTSPGELMQLLIDQEHETLRLRRALYTAVERIDTEAQRVLTMERENVEAMERFRMLNESRVVAQQDAMKASQELRLYQFQLETAQAEIDRAQETLRRVQRQKEEAEEEAVRARAQARLLHQERVVALAREEGRKDGFEAGFKRARREQSLAIKQRSLFQEGTQRGHRKAKSQPENIEAAAYNRTQLEQAFQAGVSHTGGARLEDDQLSRVSSPAQLPLRGLHDTSPEIIRVAEPNLPPPNHLNLRRTEPHYERPPSEPALMTFPRPEPGVPRSPAPSIQVYSVDIPPTAQLQKEFPLNETQRMNSQWVTAHQHLEMNGRNPSLDDLQQANNRNVDLSRGFSMMSQQAEPPKKRKESWYRTLSRRALGFRKKLEPQNRPLIDTLDIHSRPPVQMSWYTSQANPPVHIRDYGLPPKARSSMDDTASLSTRMSQLDLVSPPTHTPNDSISGISGKANGIGRRFKENTGLSVIKEDPLSRENTPVKERFPTNDRGTDHDEVRSRTSGHQEPRYSDPKAVDAWRRSGATNSIHSRDPNSRPPNTLRRPVNLTMPAPLAPDSGLDSLTSRPRTTSDNNAISSYSWAPLNGVVRQRNTHNLTVDAELSPPGISIVPPSQSPSDTLQNSGRLGNGYLSPNHSRNSHSLPSIRSARSNPAFPNSPDGGRSDLAPVSVPKALSSRTPAPSNNTNGHAVGYRFPSGPEPTSRAPQWGRASPARSARSSSPRPSSRESFSRSPSYIPQALPPDHFPGAWEGTRSNTSFGQPLNGYNEITPSMSKHDLPGTNDAHALNRVASNTSMRSGGSKHTHYDPTTYLDPAYYSVPDAPSTGQGRRIASLGPARPHSRAASTSSSLSYFDPPGRP
ncbi:hypothetical protein BDZ94DRAFT_1261229 [Collybia nuda]|uniref:Uncharacterized protein n=1 Tax=Collybia nuda TaxID=64659 RepID=A0A9P6CDZ4_9AGAR|nr:hypothetical protein BDZ94DRAFT_1261229 [Collybia nuda]